MFIMTHGKFHLNRLMLTIIFGIWASEPPRARGTTEKAGPHRVKFTWYGTKIKIFIQKFKCCLIEYLTAKVDYSYSSIMFPEWFCRKNFF